MYDVVILPVAQQDIRNTTHWYNDKGNGLGLRFTTELREKILFIRNYPKACAIRYRQMRTVILKNFPYMVHYRISDENQQIIVHALLHTSQNPDAWKKR